MLILSKGVWFLYASYYSEPEPEPLRFDPDGLLLPLRLRERDFERDFDREPRKK